jgi:hypothetical protein
MAAINPERHFIPEVLVSIFNYCTDVNTINSVSKTCKTFREAMFTAQGDRLKAMQLLSFTYQMSNSNLGRIKIKGDEISNTPKSGIQVLIQTIRDDMVKEAEKMDFDQIDRLAKQTNDSKLKSILYEILNERERAQELELRKICAD